MSRRVVHSDAAPDAIGPYSQGILAGDLFFSAMQIALDPDTGELVGGDAAGQTRRILENLEAVLGAAGLGLADVVKVTIFMNDIADFGAVNEAYAASFAQEPPARSVVEVAAIPKGAEVGIELIARRRD